MGIGCGGAGFNQKPSIAFDAQLNFSYTPKRVRHAARRSSISKYEVWEVDESWSPVNAIIWVATNTSSDCTLLAAPGPLDLEVYLSFLLSALLAFSRSGHIGNTIELLMWSAKILNSFLDLPVTISYLSTLA